MKKAYKYRIYPTDDQKEMLEKTFGACRWLYNYSLFKIKDKWENDKEKINISDIQKEIPILKNNPETEWLKEVPSIALIYTLKNLDAAYKNFFRKLKNGEIEAERKNYVKKRKEKGLEVNTKKLYNIGYPSPKRKYNNHHSFQFHQGYKVNFDEGTIDVPKAKAIPVIYHRKFYGTPKTCTISRNACGEYYVSILVETPEIEPEKQPIKPSKTITIHLGLRNFAYVHDGKKTTTIEHPQFLIKSLEKVKLLNQRLSLKQEENKDRKKDENFKGANIEKARVKLAKLHNKIKNQREYFLHGLSTELVKKYSGGTILVENWKVKEMAQEKYLAKYIMDSGWRSFWTITNYKSDWNGVNFVQAEKDFASSKTCSECGYHNKELKQQITWECPVCNTKHNREENALQNLVKNVPNFAKIK